MVTGFALDGFGVESYRSPLEYDRVLERFCRTELIGEHLLNKLTQSICEVHRTIHALCQLKLSTRSSNRFASLPIVLEYAAKYQRWIAYVIYLLSLAHLRFFILSISASHDRTATDATQQPGRVR